MSIFDAQPLPDDELVRLAREHGIEVAVIIEQAENARIHQPFEEQVQQFRLTYGWEQDRAERFIRAVRSAVAHH
jgi:hypothetical protein